MKQPSLPIDLVKPDWNSLLLPTCEQLDFSNGARLYTLASHKEGLCFFELVLRNGRWTEPKPLSARMSANLMMEGSKNLSAGQVADFIDFYGAHFSVQSDLDFTIISLSCLQKHFSTMVDFMCGLVLHPAYRDVDLEKAKVFLNSQLMHQLAEPDYVSYREFTSLIYGPETVYGYNTTPEKIQALTRDDLIRYHQENYCADYLSAFYCGSLDPSALTTIRSCLEQFPKAPFAFEVHHHLPVPSPQHLHIPIHHSAQTSLKMGIRTFPRRHSDFFGLYLVNTILGDYFGSRLMKKIREDQGLTYDIHSNLDAQVHDGCFYISAELNPDQLQEAIDLIRDELVLIRTKLVPEDELEMVRNFLCGNMLRLMDGPFQSISFIKILISEYGSPLAFQQLKTATLETTAEQLRILAQRYLDPEKMILVTAGA